MPDTTSNSASQAAAIQAAGQIVSTAGNAYAQAKINKKTQRYNDKVYERSRQDSLKDWATQNAYNSPLQQMQRYRDAGLNPNLIYGQSNTADAVRSADSQGWNPRAPNIDLRPGEVVNTYFNVKMQEAQQDNLRAAITVQNQEAILKAAQTASTIQSTAKTQQEYEQASKLNPIALQAAAKNLENTIAQTENVQASTNLTKANTLQTLDNNERQALLSSQSILESIERIGQIRINNLKTQADTAQTRAQIKAIEQGIENAKKDAEIKEENLELMRRGQNPNDPTWLRKAGEWIDKYVPSPKTFKKNVDSWYDSFKRKSQQYHGKSFGG